MKEITAKDARNNALNTLDELKFNETMGHIEAASNKGKFEIVSSEVDLIVISKLKTLGYKVTHQLGNKVLINWE